VAVAVDVVTDVTAVTDGNALATFGCVASAVLSETEHVVPAEQEPEAVVLLAELLKYALT